MVGCFQSVPIQTGLVSIQQSSEVKQFTLSAKTGLLYLFIGCQDARLMMKGQAQLLSVNSGVGQGSKFFFIFKIYLKLKNIS